MKNKYLVKTDKFLSFSESDSIVTQHLRWEKLIEEFLDLVLFSES